MRHFWLAALFLLASCGDRTPAPVLPDAIVDGSTVSQVFVATNRAANDQGYFDRTRGDALTLLDTRVSIPPAHRAGDAPRYSPNPNPAKDFVIVSQDKIGSEQAFVNEVRRELTQRLPQDREIILYVHGYHNGYSDSVFRMAQMWNDFQMEGVPIAFSWPSAAKPAGYTYDRDSVLFSRDALQEMLYLLPQTGSRNILLVGHSMGNLLIMETLRQIDIERPGWASRNLHSVVMMSPDISVDVFRSQAESMSKLPDPFVIVSSRKDSILKLSTFINMEEDRLGLGTSVDELSDLPITFVDVTDFAEAGTNPHFVAAESPALISLMSAIDDLPGYVKSNHSTLLGGVLTSTQHIQSSVVVDLSPDNDPGSR